MNTNKEFDRLNNAKGILSSLEEAQEQLLYAQKMKAVRFIRVYTDEIKSDRYDIYIPERGKNINELFLALQEELILFYQQTVSSLKKEYEALIPPID